MSYLSIDQCNQTISISTTYSIISINGCGNAIYISSPPQSILVNGIGNSILFTTSMLTHSITINGHNNSITQATANHIIVQGCNNYIQTSYSMCNIINQGFNNSIINSSHAGAYQPIPQSYQYQSSFFPMSSQSFNFSYQGNAAMNISINGQSFTINGQSQQAQQPPSRNIPVETTYLKKNATDDCVICLEHLKSGEKVRVLSCAHIFHRDCIDSWIGQSSCCPLCKTSV